jgi:hypothetical protein
MQAFIKRYQLSPQQAASVRALLLRSSVLSNTLQNAAGRICEATLVSQESSMKVRLSFCCYYWFAQPC